MDEHEDDLTSEVEEEATEEKESFPDQADDPDDDLAAGDPLNIDEDESEL